MRATSGSASSAARRPASSPSDAAAASANSAGLFRGARPACEIAVASRTSSAAASRAQPSTIPAFCAVISRSET